MVAASVDSVRLATWNVNSIKQRVPRLLPWLDQRQPDVVCLQETKLADDALANCWGAAPSAVVTSSPPTVRPNGTASRFCRRLDWTTS